MLKFSIDQNSGFFSRFLFRDQEMAVKTPVFRTVDITPGEMKDVVDAECRVQADQDQGIVAEVWLLGKVVIFEIM